MSALQIAIDVIDEGIKRAAANGAGLVEGWDIRTRGNPADGSGVVEARRRWATADTTLTITAPTTRRAAVLIATSNLSIAEAGRL